METLIFCDVDGVLNIAIKDPTCSGPLLFSNENVDCAVKCQQNAGGYVTDACVAHVLAVNNRHAGLGEDSTYAHFACPDSVMLSTIMVERLAKLINAAETEVPCQVVLSSTWRAPKHAAGVKVLERMISSALGRNFAFDDRTPLGSDRSAEERLKTIGNYIAKYWEGRKTRLRVLVLEDFSASSLDGSWHCGTHCMDCVEDAEAYLKARAAKGRPMAARDDVACCLIHTYDHWQLPPDDRAADFEGEWVHIGCGLTWQHFSRAREFLDTGALVPKVRPIVVEGTGGGEQSASDSDDVIEI